MVSKFRPLVKQAKFLLKNRAFISVLFLLAALSLNFYQFTSFPPLYGLGFEELETGVNAHRALYTGFNLPAESPINPLKICNYFPVPCSHLITNVAATISFLFLGESIFSLRLPFVIMGSLTIPFFYLLLAELVTTPIAIFGAFLLMTARWHVFGSRIADELFTGLFLQLPLLYFFVKSIKYNRKRDFFLTGLFLGLLAYEYMGYRAGLIFVTLGEILYFLKQTFKARLIFPGLIRIGIFLVTSLIIVSPLLYYLASGNDLLLEGFRRHANDRIGGGYRPLLSMVENNFLEILPDQKIISERISQTKKVFISNIGGIPELGEKLPLFDPFTHFLLIPSFIYILIKIYKPQNLFFLSWFISVFCVAAFFPINFYPGRFVSILALAYIFIVLFLDEIFLLLKSKQNLKRIFIVLMIIALASSSFSNLKVLYFQQPQEGSVLGVFSSKRSESACASNPDYTWVCKSLENNIPEEIEQ